METIPRGCDANDGDRTPAVKQEVWLAHVCFARTGDPQVLRKLVDEYESYAIALAGRLHRGFEPREDLDQLAREALVVALRRFDPDRGLPFAAFATPTILGAVRRHYRDRGWLVRVPRRFHELAAAVRSTTETLVSDLGRQPSLVEVADALGLSVDELIEAQEAELARSSVSLDAPAHAGGCLGDDLGGEDPALDRVVDANAACEAMAMLDEQSREVLRLYFFEELTQSAIAERFGVSQMQVSRLIAAALRCLRRRAGAC